MVRRTSKTPAEPAEVVLADPADVRALAHPARLTVIDALFAGEVLTATECAERAGVTPSAMSYHLRALEKSGLVTRAESRGDARERPWKRAAASLRIDLARTRAEGNGAALSAAELLVSNSLDLDRARLLASLRADAARGPDEARGSTYDRDVIVATREELREIAGQVDAVLSPYRRANRTAVPEGATTFSASFVLAQETPDQP